MRTRTELVLGLLLLGLALVHPAQARLVPVDSTAGLVAAITAARPGDEIVLADGAYALDGNHGVNCVNAGTAAAPVVVRAAHPLGARIESSAVEAFSVSAPDWRFEGLDIRGTCPDDSACEHAFHVVGRATGFQMLRNRVADFNAHIKVNADLDRNQPNGGLIEGNEFLDTHPRRTGEPVTPVNIDVADDWVVRGNVIRDFYKALGDQTSYGAFAKGGARRPVFERNLVLCADLDKIGGVRVGLSFGGGGMDPALCAPGWNAAVACDPEVEGGVMRDNIVANCSDDGIYLNRARDTKLLYNTLVATQQIVFRFPSSTGEAVGNVLSSRVTALSGGSFVGRDNLTDVPLGQFAAWYQDPLRGDLRRKGGLGALLGKGEPRPDVRDDYCGRARAGHLDLGALQASAGDCATAGQAPGASQRRLR
jgi:nitrous oxidase accessory protein NosD